MNQIFFSIKFWFSVINQPANEEGFCGWDRTFGIASKFLCHRFSFADYSTGKRIPELFRVDLTTSAALFLSLLLFFFLKVSMNKFTDGDDLWVGCHTLFSARLISVAERTPNAIPDDCKRFRFYFSDGWYSEGGGVGRFKRFGHIRANSHDCGTTNGNYTDSTGSATAIYRS